MDWRTDIPEDRRRPIRAWLYTVAAMVFGVLIVGGITRLTRSGLSMVEWNPLLGFIPPLNHEQWLDVFHRYQQYPEYQQLRQGMSLGEFKFIFFWEFTHRLLARSIGVVFLLPMLFFWLKGWFNRLLLARALVLFALGGLQGLMGWLMVASGLVDRPSVSHFRLAAHLSLAFIICAYAFWLVRELRIDATRARTTPRVRALLVSGLTITGVLLALQIVWGAFVAGLKAGHYANTFPLMGGRWVPRGLLAHDPAWLAFLENPITVQWTHRVIGTLLALAVLVFVVRALRAGLDPRSRTHALVLLALMAVQYALGVLTLIYYVPIPLAAAHQATALVLFLAWVSWLHHARNLGTG